MFAFLAPAALKLLFGKALGNAASDAKAVGHWLGTLTFYQLGCLVLGAAFAFQTIRIDGLKIWPVHVTGLNAKLADANGKLANATNALDQTVANYRAAAVKAAADDKANAVRVMAEQSKINQESSDDYEARIAAARAVAARLQQQLAAAAHSGGGPAAPVPGVPASASGPAQTSGQNGLPQHPGQIAPAPAPLSIADRLTATEEAIQLDAIIKWAIRQHSVDPNAAAAPPQAKP